MASTITYHDFILEQLKELKTITCRPMMGEYLLFYNGILFGGIYDDRLLIKKTESNQKYQLPEALPYPNAQPMYYIDNVDNKDLLKSIVMDTYSGLN